MSTRFVIALTTVFAVVVACGTSPSFAEEKGSPIPPPATRPVKPLKEKDKPPAKLYRFKSVKKGGLGDAQAMVLVIEDMISGKSDSVYVPNTDPASGKYEPVASIASIVDGLKPGDPIEVASERQKGRPMVVSLARANLAPGEEYLNHYVLVAWDKQKGPDGKPIMAVKLKKFGREITLPVQLVKNADTDDWAAPWMIEYVLGKVEPGGVVEAKIKPGKPPVLQDLNLYRPPERGKFVEFTEAFVNNATQTAFAFKMSQGDVTLTITLPGTEVLKGDTKVLMPDQRLLAAVRKLKPGMEIEVLLVPGDEYILREVRAIPPAKK